MLTKQDMTFLKGLFEQFGTEIKRDMRDEIHSCISASEVRMNARMDKLEIKMVQLKEETVSEIRDFIDEAIIPQIDELYVEVDNIKRYVKVV